MVESLLNCPDFERLALQVNKHYTESIDKVARILLNQFGYPNNIVRNDYPGLLTEFYLGNELLGRVKVVADMDNHLVNVEYYCKQFQ